MCLIISKCYYDIFVMRSVSFPSSFLIFELYSTDNSMLQLRDLSL